MSPSPRPRGGLEREVLAALAASTHPMTATHVLADLGGGLAYTLGAVVYALKWPDPWPRTFGYHEVFHAFTIVGAGLHMACIAFVVLPKG